MAEERTLEDVRRELKTKRNLLVLAMENRREAQESVNRSQGHIDLVAAQIHALATEEREFERRQRSAVTA